MISEKTIPVLLLLVFLGGCQPQGYPDKKKVDWEADIFLEEGATKELERYFKVLDAEEVHIYSTSSYEAENSEELLFIRLKESQFLSAKTPAQQEKIIRRMAHLVFSRLMYPYAYLSITLIHSELIGDSGESNYADSFQWNYSTENLELGEDGDLEASPY